MIKKTSKKEIRKRKHLRVRKKISGTPERPRLNVYRSLSHIYAQIIDDVNHKTLVFTSSLDKDLNIKYGGNVEASKVVGAKIAKLAIEAGIKDVVFDRSGYVYHGRVASLAEAAREAGLNF